MGSSTFDGQKSGAVFGYGMAPMKLEDLNEVCKTKKVALADPNIPAFCSYIGLDKKGKKKTQGKEIQLVVRDQKKGWVLLLALLWVANKDQEIRMPESEEVLGTLGAVVSQPNIAKNNCHFLYKPKMDK